jgi:hypothetical protein
MSKFESTDNTLIEMAMTKNDMSLGVNYILCKRVEKPDVYNCAYPKVPLLRVSYEVYVAHNTLGLPNVVDFLDAKELALFKVTHGVKDDEG